MILDKKPDLTLNKCEFNLQVNGLNEPVPCIFLKALKQDVDSIVIFNHGLNGSKDSLNFLKHHLNNAHLIGFDARACAKNKNEGTSHYNEFALDLKKIIDTLKQDLSYLNVDRYYLIGESFGAAVCLLFYKKYQDDINGVFIWNMPRKIIDVTGTKKIQQLKLGLSIMWSLITNLPTYSNAPAPIDKLSNNRTLFLATKLTKQHIKDDNRNIIAAWLGNYKAWRVLLSKKFINNAKKDIIYISSKTDPLRDNKACLELDAALNKHNSNHIFHYDLNSGTHILFFDIYLDKFILDGIDKFIEIDHQKNNENFIQELKKLENLYECKTKQDIKEEN